MVAISTTGHDCVVTGATTSTDRPYIIIHMTPLTLVPATPKGQKGTMFPDRHCVRAPSRRYATGKINFFRENPHALETRARGDGGGCDSSGSLFAGALSAS